MIYPYGEDSYRFLVLGTPAAPVTLSSFIAERVFRTTNRFATRR